MFRKKAKKAALPAAVAPAPVRPAQADPVFRALAENVSQADAAGMNGLSLAFFGDAVWELLVRTQVLIHEKGRPQALHEKTIGYVNAAFQARAGEALFPLLTDDERAAFLRGRNASPGHTPRNQKTADYHKATGLEALFGWLYLTGQTDRLTALFARILEEEKLHEEDQNP